MPPEFLMQQMELREALEEATEKKNSQSLDRLRSDLRREEAVLVEQIAEAIDVRRDYAAAAGLVRKLMFLDRLDEEIDLAYEATD
jgi:molecular chaperone HscB